MSKSILVIDTPTRCYDCPLYTSIGDEDGCADEYGFCDDRNILNQKEAQDKIRFDEKPTWCPLKPLPNKWHDTSSIARGFNKCIDEITGETE